MLTDQTHFAFNVWSFESARAVIDAAASLQQDVILQTSTSIYKELPAKMFSGFVKSYAASVGVNAWLNIDHCKERETLLHAIDHGWDMVMVDASFLPLMDNIYFTNEIAEHAHRMGVLVEAEVGQVRGIEDDTVVRQDTIASKQDIQLFLNAANIDFIAAAFGNAHGEYTGMPDLHYELVEFTTGITDISFVVHGGSGLSDDVLKRLLAIRGVRKINISTDLKKAYKNGLRKALENWSQPINATNMIHDEIFKTAISKMKLIEGELL